MANTTDMIITCFETDTLITMFGKDQGLKFERITDEDASGGDRSVCFSSYAACHIGMDQEKIQEVILAFQALPFTSPELAALIIDDDNGRFSGLVSPIVGVVTGDTSCARGATGKPELSLNSLSDLDLNSLGEAIDASEEQSPTTSHKR